MGGSTRPSNTPSDGKVSTPAGRTWSRWRGWRRGSVARRMSRSSGCSGRGIDSPITLGKTVWKTALRIDVNYLRCTLRGRAWRPKSIGPPYYEGLESM